MSSGRPRLELSNIRSSCKNRNRYVTQGLLLLKNNLFIKSSILVLVLFIVKGSLWVPDLETLGYLQGTSTGRCVLAGMVFKDKQQD